MNGQSCWDFVHRATVPKQVSSTRGSSLLLDEDIKIEFTGLRPGEKMYEELLMNEEGLKETANRDRKSTRLNSSHVF